MPAWWPAHASTCICMQLCMVAGCSANDAPYISAVQVCAIKQGGAFAEEVVVQQGAAWKVPGGARAEVTQVLRNQCCAVLCWMEERTWPARGPGTCCACCFCCLHPIWHAACIITSTGHVCLPTCRASRQMPAPWHLYSHSPSGSHNRTTKAAALDGCLQMAWT